MEMECGYSKFVLDFVSVEMIIEIFRLLHKN